MSRSGVAVAVLLAHAWVPAAGQGLMETVANVIGCGLVQENLEVPGELPAPTPTYLGCHEPMVHNCIAMTQLPRLCHDPACPYVAPSADFKCVFSCEARENCSRGNPEFAFPNNRTHVCERCDVVGCKVCSSRRVCAQCMEHFNLGPGGDCTYTWDEHAKSGLSVAVPVIVSLTLLTLIVFSLVDACGCCGRCLPQEAPPEGEEALEAAVEEVIAHGDVQHAFQHPEPRDGLSGAIDQGKRHRLCCKIKDLQIDAESLGTRWRRIPFFVNLRSRFLAGVGLPLFHQWYFFIFVYSLVMCAGTAWVYYGAGFDTVLQRVGIAQATELYQDDTSVSLCGIKDERLQVWQSAKLFGYRAAVGYLVLWVIGVILSLLHALRQRHIVKEFYEDHVSLAEFALSVEGFPAEATDEGAIRRFLQDAFGSQDLDVSVCYDFRDRVGRVRELVEKILVEKDVDCGTYPARLGGGLGGRQALGLSMEDKREVREWLRPGARGGLANAGSAFVIFPHTYDLHMVKDRLLQDLRSAPSAARRRAAQAPPPPRPVLPHSKTPEWLPAGTWNLRWIGGDGRTYPLRIRDVVCEPPEVVWEHLGRSDWVVLLYAVLGYGAVGLTFAFMAAVLFYPLAAYSKHYVDLAGSAPSGMVMTLMGLLTMSATWLILLSHIRISSSVGFSRRDREGIMVFRSWTAQCLVSFLFNVAITIFPQVHGDPLSLLTQDLLASPMQVIEDITFQTRAAVHLFHVLVPGGLYLGYLLFPLQGFVWPFVSTLGVLRCLYGRSFGPELRAREAEIQLEPLGLSLGHDYMGHVFQPISCSLLLFFASGVVWQVFGFLALWSIFMSVFSRYIHLRATKRSLFSTNRIDTDALVAWGFPLSMVLAASAFWAVKLRGWSMWLVPLAFVAGYAVYFFLLLWGVRPLAFCKDESRINRPSYSMVRARRFYDWHNCNPIKVLASHCLDHADVKPIIPFEVGKEYLQANSEEWHASIKRSMTGGDLVTRRHSELVRNMSGAQESPAGRVNCTSWFGLNADLPEVESLIDHRFSVQRWKPHRPLRAEPGDGASTSPERSEASPPREDVSPPSQPSQPASPPLAGAGDLGAAHGGDLGAAAGSAASRGAGGAAVAAAEAAGDQDRGPVPRRVSFQEDPEDEAAAEAAAAEAGPLAPAAGPPVPVPAAPVAPPAAAAPEGGLGDLLSDDSEETGQPQWRAGFEGM